MCFKFNWIPSTHEDIVTCEGGETVREVVWAFVIMRIEHFEQTFAFCNFLIYWLAMQILVCRHFTEFMQI